MPQADSALENYAKVREEWSKEPTKEDIKLWRTQNSTTVRDERFTSPEYVIDHSLVLCIMSIERTDSGVLFHDGQVLMRYVLPAGLRLRPRPRGEESTYQKKVQRRPQRPSLSSPFGWIPEIARFVDNKIS